MCTPNRVASNIVVNSGVLIAISEKNAKVCLKPWVQIRVAFGLVEVLKISNRRRRYLKDIKLSSLFSCGSIQPRLLRSGSYQEVRKLCTFVK